MPTTTLTSKGQVTIPKEVRERLGLSEGDRLEFVFDERGRVIVRPEKKSGLDRLSGRLKHMAPEKPVTIDEMRAAILERAKRKYSVREDQ
jgi:AbrB family looped-hinge helix DNA binding protein